MGFGNLNALVVDHLYWSGTSICDSLKRLGIEHEYATSSELAETLMMSGKQIGSEGYGVIITETALLVSPFARMKVPMGVVVAADLTGDDIVTDAKPEVAPIGPDVVRLARSYGQEPFVIAHYDEREHMGLWTPDNPCDHLLTRNEALRHDILEKILRERFGG